MISAKIIASKERIKLGRSKAEKQLPPVSAWKMVTTLMSQQRDWRTMTKKQTRLKLSRSPLADASLCSSHAAYPY